MKTVFANDMVAHVWAQQTQSEGRSSNGNFWFEGDTIYSYRTPIARIVTTPKGERVALITSATYSVTTSGKHMPAVHRALGYGKLMPDFRVPFLGVTGGRQNYSGNETGAMHTANLAALASEYNNLKTKLRRARGPYQPATVLERASLDASNYARLFELPDPALPHMVDASEIAVHHHKRNEKNNTPEAIAKREKERAARERRKAEKEERERRERFERETEQRERWLNGEISYWRGYDENGGALLRLNMHSASDHDNAQVLQTSLGASVPLTHAIKAFRFIKLIKERGQPWHRNGHTVRVGHFQVDSVDEQGNIHAGCHLINWNEIERIAKQLNIFDEPATDDALESTSHAA